MAARLFSRSLWQCVLTNEFHSLQAVSFRCLYLGRQMRCDNDPPFDRKLLEILVCPLSKKPLRYDSMTNELISDEIGVAYSIQNGIPNLIPHDGRLLKKDSTNLKGVDSITKDACS